MPHLPGMAHQVGVHIFHGAHQGFHKMVLAFLGFLGLPAEAGDILEDGHDASGKGSFLGGVLLLPVQKNIEGDPVKMFLAVSTGRASSTPSKDGSLILRSMPACNLSAASWGKRSLGDLPASSSCGMPPQILANSGLKMRTPSVALNRTSPRRMESLTLSSTCFWSRMTVYRALK